jgi:hypothetical protein
MPCSSWDWAVNHGCYVPGYYTDATCSRGIYPPLLSRSNFEKSTYTSIFQLLLEDVAGHHMIDLLGAVLRWLGVHRRIFSEHILGKFNICTVDFEN